MSKPRKGSLVAKAAKHTMRLLGDGNRTPTTSQVLNCTGRRRPKNKEAFRQFFQSLRRYIEKHYMICVCSISELAYKQHRGPKGKVIRKPYVEVPPADAEEINQCLPGGTGKYLGGLYFPKANDVIYEAWLLKYCSQALKMLELNSTRVFSGMEHTCLPRNTPLRLKNLMSEHMQGNPEAYKPLLEEMVGHVIASLPKPEKK